MFNYQNKILIFAISIFLVFISKPSKAFTLSLNAQSDTLQYISNDNEYNFVIAALKGDYPIVESLLKKGMNPNTIIDESITALIYAAQAGNVKICELLISKGADINFTPRVGHPALIASVRSGHPEVFEFLIKNGADINITDDLKRTCLMYATAFGDTLMTRRLLELKADISIRDIDGLNAFISAVISLQFTTAQMMLDAGLKVDDCDKNNISPIMIATGNNDTKTIDWLLQRGANINLISKHHQTALTIAIDKKDETLIQYLLDKGANVNQNLTFAETPLTIAKYHKVNNFIIESLQAKGAKQNILPDFRRVTAGPEFSWNLNDFMFGLSAGVKEYKYKFDLNTGILFRPFSKRTLTPYSTNKYFQYWEWRNYAYIEFAKHFDLLLGSNSNYGLNIGAQGIYTFGNYRGTSVYVPVRYLIAPEVGFYQTTKHFQFGINYKYMDFRTPEVSPHRIDLSFKVIIGSLFDFDIINYKPWD